MALHVIYANELEALVEPFVRNAGLDAARPDLFARVPVVVPHTAAATFLKFQTAARLGVAANIDCRFIDGFLTGLLHESRPEIHVLDRATVQALLLGVFEEAAPAGALKPVHEYVNAPGADAETRARRGFQLAGQMAGLFLEYASSWPEIFAAWRTGGSFLADKRFFSGAAAAHTARFASTERWQRALWLALHERCGAAGRRLASDHDEGVPRRLLLIEEAWDQVRPHELKRVPPQVHLFAATLVGEVYRSILAKLAEVSEVFVYAQNPCREYWEDVHFGKVFRPARTLGNAARFGENPFGFGESDESPALRLWGRPGREKVRLLNELSECDFEDRFCEPQRRGRRLLQRVQQDIFFGKPPVEKCPPDDSLRVVAAADVRREVEIVANEIWRRVEDASGSEAPLRWHEIAVLVADDGARASYVSQIAAVFESLNDMPFRVLEQPPAAGSRLAEAAALLLDLPYSGFARPEVLPLLTHPNVSAKVPGADAARFAAWTERLNILFEPDYAAVRENTYVTKDLFNWEQGLKRLALGSLLAGERSGVTAPFALDGNAYLVEETNRDEQATAGAFVLLVRSLIEDARFLRTAVEPLAEWSRLLVRYVRAYLAPLDDADEKSLERIAGALHGLRDIDVDGRAVDAATALAFAKSAAESAGSGGGHGRAGGIVVASPSAVRAVPFRAVFVLGLGEGRFPAAERRNPLDLRGIRRRAGDITARERDKYVFLETLLAARDSLTLSYVNRTPAGGDKTEPSAVLKELQFVLAGYLDAAALRAFVHEQPLRRFDAAYFPALTPSATPPPGPNYAAAAWREARARRLHDLIRAGVGDLRPYPESKEIPALFGEAWPQVAEALGTVAIAPVAPGADGAVLTITLAQLRAFLECPLQGAASYLLGLRDEDDGAEAEREDEVLTPEKGDNTVLLRAAFWEAPCDREHSRAAVARLYEAAELRGVMPTGPFGRVALAGAQEQLAPWQDNLALFGIDFAGWSPVRFGRTETGDRTLRVEPPIVIPVELPGGVRVHVELSGTTEAAAPDGSTVMTLHAKEKCEHKDFYRAFLSTVALAAAGIGASKPTSLFINPATPIGKVDSWARIVEPISQADAIAWIAGVLRDLLSADHAILFPAKPVFTHLKGQLRTPYKDRETATLRARLENEPDDGSTCEYGPVPMPWRFPIPPVEEIDRILAIRWSLYNEKLFSVKEFAERHPDPGAAPSKKAKRPKKGSA